MTTFNIYLFQMKKSIDNTYLKIYFNSDEITANKSKYVS